MKYTLITLSVATLFCAATASAQMGVAKKILPVVTIGVRAGVNMQQTKGILLDGSMGVGYLGGAFVGVSKKKMGVRLEALIKSAKMEFEPITVFGTTLAPTAVKTVALDIPLLFEYSVISRLKLHVGPQFTSILSAKQGDTDVKSALASSDISIAAGAEVFLPLKFTVCARYIQGFSNMNTSSSDKWTNSSIQLSVGYRFLN